MKPRKNVLIHWIIFYKPWGLLFITWILKLLIYDDVTNLFQKKTTKSTIFIKAFQKESDSNKTSADVIFQSDSPCIWTVLDWALDRALTILASTLTKSSISLDRTGHRPSPGLLVGSYFLSKITLAKFWRQQVLYCLQNGDISQWWALLDLIKFIGKYSYLQHQIKWIRHTWKYISSLVWLY